MVRTGRIREFLGRSIVNYVQMYESLLKLPGPLNTCFHRITEPNTRDSLSLPVSPSLELIIGRYLPM